MTYTLARPAETVAHPAKPLTDRSAPEPSPAATLIFHLLFRPKHSCARRQERGNGVEISGTTRPSVRPSATGFLLAANRLLCESLHRHRAVAVLIFTFAFASHPVAWIAGAPDIVDNFYLYDIFALLLGACVIVLALTAIVSAMIARPEDSLYAAIARDLAARLNRERLVNLLAPLLLAPLFFSTFSSFKTLIPYLSPFAWDEAFMRWDRWLHGGVDPWRLLQPVLGGALPTRVIDALYYLWIPAMLGVFWWQAGSTKRGALRMRFLLSFLLCWILIGTVLATALSSAGPCYFGRITGLPDPFAPLLANLHRIAGDVPLFALSTQDMLWQAHQHRATTVGAGISAMPSMHVAIAVLLALFGWRIGRRAGVLFTAFAVLTMLGSVHLGWHYAIDGYLGAVAAAAIWYGVGRALRRAETPPRRAAAAGARS